MQQNNKTSSKTKINAAIIAIFLVCFQLQSTFAAPRPQAQNDIDDYGGDLGLNGMGSNANGEFNSVMGHFKDFVMYLPVMMTTLKETMTGFPKFAEGLRILTSKNGRLEGGGAGGDCNCHKDGSSNEIDLDRF